MEIEGERSGCAISSTNLTGGTVVAVQIRVYNATEEVNLKEDNVPQGTRLLLICDVEGLPEGNVVISYKWYHNCSTGRCEIQEGDPYYTALNDTLLVDATSWEGWPRRFFCEVKYYSEQRRSDTQSGFTTLIRLTSKMIYVSDISALPQSCSIPHPADSSILFLFAPTSLLPNHALVTDVQQITGSNGQQWIKCTIGRAMGGVVIYFAANNAIISASINTAVATFGPGRGRSNGLYYCRAGGSQKYYVSLFLNKIRDSSKCTTYVQHSNTLLYTNYLEHPHM